MGLGGAMVLVMPITFSLRYLGCAKTLGFHKFPKKKKLLKIFLWQIPSFLK
jgi:hypothetical protein